MTVARSAPISPIPTAYGGVKFRSRHEARWAVFFDHLDVKWIYEAEGFDTSAGYYLPDFYLPQLDVWIEIKPEAPTSGEVEKCRALAEGVPGTVRLMYGPIGWWDWSLSYQPARMGGVGFWTESEPDGTPHAFADEDHRYQPALCGECGRLAFPLRGKLGEKCGAECGAPVNPMDQQDHEKRLRFAADASAVYQFEYGGR